MFGLFKNKEIFIVANELKNKVETIIKIFKKLDKPSLTTDLILSQLDKNKIKYHKQAIKRIEIDIILGDEKNYKLFSGLSMFVNKDGIDVAGINDYYGFYIKYEADKDKLSIDARDIYKLMGMKTSVGLTKKAISLKKELDKLI